MKNQNMGANERRGEATEHDEMQRLAEDALKEASKQREEDGGS